MESTPPPLNPYETPEAAHPRGDSTDPLWHPLASKGKRFLNYVVDQFAISFGVIGIGFLAREAGLSQEPNENGVIVLAMLVYYTVLEGLGGQTLGKLCTGTREVLPGGVPIGMKKALLRTLCRFIPFEWLILLGSSQEAWHDSLPGTLVVDIRQAPMTLGHSLSRL